MEKTFNCLQGSLDKYFLLKFKKSLSLVTSYRQEVQWYQQLCVKFENLIISCLNLRQTLPVVSNAMISTTVLPVSKFEPLFSFKNNTWKSSLYNMC